MVAMFYSLKPKAKTSLAACAVLEPKHLSWQVEQATECLGLAKFSTSSRRALLGQQVSHIGSRLHASSADTGSRTLAQLRHAAQAAILLLNGLVQQSWSELCKCALDVATSQSTSGRGTLKQSLFALLCQGLEGLATSNSLNGSLLCLWAL
jgi:hypothetical protein